MEEKKDVAVVQRKKLWQVDPDFLCATIGSCLTRSELHKLAREKVFKPGYKPDDYELHSYFIRVAKSEDVRGKALHRHLEKKYRQATRKYFLTSDPSEIEALWRQDLTEGRLDSGWWAVATHPVLSLEAISGYYRQLHMLAHEAIAGHQQKLREEQRQQEAMEKLTERLARDKATRLADSKALGEEREKARVASARLKVVEEENRQLRQQLFQLAAKAEQARTAAEEDGSQLPLERQLEEAVAENRRVLARVSEIEAQQQRWSLLQEEQAHEIAALENLLRQHVDETDPCAGCEEQGCACCPGPDLCGRTVLYVGGRDRMVPHFKKLVETLGGRFLHHDGGRENSRNLLPKMLATADAVFCPVDCISHDACTCVKKLCKRQQKRFVMMRSASLSALAKGLNELVQ